MEVLIWCDGRRLRADVVVDVVVGHDLSDVDGCCCWPSMFSYGQIVVRFDATNGCRALDHTTVFK